MCHLYGGSPCLLLQPTIVPSRRLSVPWAERPSLNYRRFPYSTLSMSSPHLSACPSSAKPNKRETDFGILHRTLRLAPKLPDSQVGPDLWYANRMSVNDLADHIETIAQQAAFEAKAIKTCHFHDDVILRTYDPDAEKLSYAIATNKMKAENLLDTLREDVLEAVKDVIEMADDECAQCGKHRDA